LDGRWLREEEFKRLLKKGFFCSIGIVRGVLDREGKFDTIALPFWLLYGVWVLVFVLVARLSGIGLEMSFGLHHYLKEERLGSMWAYC
jgi:hypothetical protein